LVASGQSATVAIIVANGATPYLPSAFQIDGVTTNTTFYWQGGSAPTAANASVPDVYEFTVICTNASTSPHTYSVFASQTKF